MDFQRRRPRDPRFAAAMTVIFASVTAFSIPAIADGIGHNGLSTESLSGNALTTNPRALKVLITRPLATATFNEPDPDYPAMQFQLEDPRARDVMTDLVGCALKPDASVMYQSHKWVGEQGLCQNAVAGDWSKSPPSAICLQLVTACLLARVNGLHRRVPISLHGPSGLFPLRPELGSERRYRESKPGEGLSEGTPIVSFIGPLCQVGTDCNWQPGLVGMCGSGTVHVEAKRLDATHCAQTRLRACRGVYGCDDPASNNVVPATASAYSGMIKTSSGCSLSFKCDGAYSVMSRPDAGNLGASIGVLPASEREIYSFREGGYFGNLFEPEGVDKTAYREVIPGKRIVSSDPVERLPYKHVYSCFSVGTKEDFIHNGTEGVTYLNDRICDNPHATRCFPHPPRQCRGTDAIENYHCDWSDAAHAFTSCKGPLGEPYLPITVYLDDPCSLAASRRAACAK